MEDLSLRTEFRRALDVVAPPAPWLAANVRAELRRRRQERLVARQRGRFGLSLSPAATRLLAIALIVMLMVAAGGAFIAIHRFVLQPNPIHTHPGAVSRTCSSGGVDMITPTTGWQGTSRTTDGGTTWRDVSPPAIPATGKGGGSTCTLDANHAWVTQAISTGCAGKGPCAGPVVTQLYVLSTSDGGVTWRTSQPIRTSGPSMEIQFFDDMHGWLLTDTVFTAASHSVRELFFSSDGGLHWSLKARGTAGDATGIGNIALSCGLTGMTFSSLTTGWLTWDCRQGNGPNAPIAGTPQVAVTRDGGVTWKPISLGSTDLTCGAMPPIFSAKIGVLLMTCPFGTVVYRTADTGQTWLAGATTPNSQVDFVDGATGFYFTYDNTTKVSTLYTTTNGGGVWSMVKSGLFAGRTVNDFQFIDYTTGFANLTNSPVAWVTHDGGKTWALPPPFRSVGSQICTAPTDPGAGSAPSGVRMFSPTFGWAAGARRTTDGGTGWTTVSPPSVQHRSSGYAEFFLDTTHAWVAQVSGSATACADQITVFGTTDGGSTWQHGPALVVPATNTAKIQSELGVSVSFVDSINGWLLVYPTVTPGQYNGNANLPPARMYRTTDGGRSWSQVSGALGLKLSGCSPSGQMVFSSTATGWIQNSCGQNSNLPLGVTRDGGVTWSPTAIAKSSCCVGGSLPTFFNAVDGMEIDYYAALFAETSDGGRTWVRHGLPRLSYFTCFGKGGPQQCSNQSIPALSFIDPSHGWAIETKDLSGHGGPFSLNLERTADGGKTWSTVSANLPRVNSYFDPSQWNLTFVDSNAGFLWVGSKLFTTSDGGHAWTAIHVTYS